MSKKKVKTIRVTVVMDEDQLGRIKQYMIANGIFSHSAAMLRLIEKGLNIAETKA